MTWMIRLRVLAALTFIAVAASGCIEEGIGMGVPSSGARFTGPSNTPSVLVAGGPVY